MNPPKTDVRHFRDLEIYRTALEAQQLVFTLSKGWPREETYALTDQIRRSSRALGANLAEAWAKRPYPAHFLSKLTDVDGELQETRHWILTSSACGYLSSEDRQRLEAQLDRIGGMLGSMIGKYETFCLR